MIGIQVRCNEEALIEVDKCGGNAGEIQMNHIKYHISYSITILLNDMMRTLFFTKYAVCVIVEDFVPITLVDGSCALFFPPFFPLGCFGAMYVDG